MFLMGRIETTMHVTWPYTYDVTRAGNDHNQRNSFLVVNAARQDYDWVLVGRTTHWHVFPAPSFRPSPSNDKVLCSLPRATPPPPCRFQCWECHLLQWDVQIYTLKNGELFRWGAEEIRGGGHFAILVCCAGVVPRHREWPEKTLTAQQLKLVMKLERKDFYRPSFSNNSKKSRRPKVLTQKATTIMTGRPLLRRIDYVPLETSSPIVKKDRSSYAYHWDEKKSSSTGSNKVQLLKLNHLGFISFWQKTNKI